MKTKLKSSPKNFQKKLTTKMVYEFEFQRPSYYNSRLFSSYYPVGIFFAMCDYDKLIFHRQCILGVVKQSFESSIVLNYNLNVSSQVNLTKKISKIFCRLANPASHHLNYLTTLADIMQVFLY